MSDAATTYVKMVNLTDPKTGKPILDRKTHQPLSRAVQMTPEEIAAFEAERAATAAAKN